MSRHDPLAAARHRAATRRAQYVDAGWWQPMAFDLVAEAGDAAGERIAVISRTETMTHAELERDVSAADGALRDAGVHAGTAVLVVASNTAGSIVAIHAAIRTGALVLLATASAGRSHLDQVIDGCNPSVAVADEEWLAANDQSAGPAWLTTATLCAGTDSSDATSPRDPDEPAVVLFTSGTTSKPKGVVHSLNTLWSASRNYIDGAELTADDRIFLVSPLASITGVLQAITVPVMLRAPVVVEDRFDPPATLPLLVETGSTWFGGPDLLLDRLMDEADVVGADLPISAVYVGGTMLDRRILDRAEQRDIVVMRAYGSSEAPISTAGARSEPADVRLGDEGRPLGGVEVRLGSDLDPNECCVRGPHLFLGYVDPDDDEGALVDDWFATGDVASLHDGRLEIVGRIKDIVIRNGLKIPMSEVEGLAATHPGVERAAAFGVPDDTTGERLVLAVQTKAAEPIDLDALLGTLTDAGLAKWKLPEELVHWTDPLPETATGKVNRKDLADGSADRPSQQAQRLRSS